MTQLWQSNSSLQYNKYDFGFRKDTDEIIDRFKDKVSKEFFQSVKTELGI